MRHHRPLRPDSLTGCCVAGRRQFHLLLVTSIACLCITDAIQAASYEEGRTLYDQGEFRRAVWVWEIAATGGDVNAQFALGHMYFKGQGIEIDLAESTRWYRSAATQGHATAQLNLGNAYHKGRGVSIDEATAVHWWTLAANQGLAAAQFNLGINYANGTGVEQDQQRALQWFREAANNGHQRAKALFD